MWWGYLVRRGRKVVLKEANHPEEVRRIAVFWGLVGITCVILYIMASFWPNQDGSWHQTAVRDTALTPAHIPMFFLFFPSGSPSRSAPTSTAATGCPRCTGPRRASRGRSSS